MQNKVVIKLKYTGYFKGITLKTQEEIKVDCILDEAFKAVVEYIQVEYGIKPPYSAIVDGKHITTAIREELVLKGGEVLSLVPHVSGG